MGSPGTGACRLPQLSKFIPNSTNSTLKTANQINVPVIPQVGPQEYLTWYHEDPPMDFSLIFNLLLYIILLTMVLTWPVIQYPIKISTILGICTIFFGSHKRTWN